MYENGGIWKEKRTRVSMMLSVPAQLKRKINKINFQNISLEGAKTKLFSLHKLSKRREGDFWLCVHLWVVVFSEIKTGLNNNI